MEFIVIVLLVVVVLAFVAYPLLKPTADEPRPTADALDSLIAQRDSAYDAIRDLDFDFQMGKLSRADYEMLREKYKLRAAAILQEIDKASRTPEADAQIEAQVARLRRRRETATDGRALNEGGAFSEGEAIEQEVARLRRRSTASADTTHPAGTEQIEEEVAQLRSARNKAPAALCPNCGTPARPGDRYCAKCGGRL